MANSASAQPQSADEIDTLNRQVEQLFGQGNYTDAATIAELALTLAEGSLGGEHPSTLESINNLAMLRMSQDRYDEAEPLHKRALEGFERVLGAEHPNTLTSLSNLADLYGIQGRYGEAQPLWQRALEASERVLGKDHPDTLNRLNNLAGTLESQGRYNDAEPLDIRALETRERVEGNEHADTLTSLNNLAVLYVNQGRYGEAEPLNRRALETSERVLGKEHPGTLASLINLAVLHNSQGRYGEAEPLFRRALEASERVLGETHPHTLACIGNLAILYWSEGRYSEAEPLYIRALEVREPVFGKEHPDTLLVLTNLASFYYTQERYSEAEPLYLRALEAYERVLGKEHPNSLVSLNNLAALYANQERYSEAAPLYQRVLEASQRVLGEKHPHTLAAITHLAALYDSQERYDEAEPLYRRALQSREQVLGAEHPDTLVSLNLLALLYFHQGCYGEAEPLYQRALEASERVLGKEHPDTLASINNLAALYFAQGDWALATVLLGRSTTTLAKRSLLGTPEALEGKKKSEAAQSDLQFWRLVKAVNRLAEGREAVANASREMFKTAQWALGSEAAQSLAQMAARGSKADPELARMVRERQDMVAEWQRRDALRSDWLAETPDKRSAKAEAENAARLAAIYARVVEIDQWLAAGFPEYAALVSPEPISIDAVQAHLEVDEALVLFLDTPEWKPTPEETFIWVVTKTDARWVRSDLGKAALTREVQALRCGLDEEEWATPTKSVRCAALLDLAAQPNSSQPLPFHLGKAHALYRALFGQVEGMIAGKRLLIVPSGALTSLPFHVLLTEAPGTALPDKFDGYRDVAWLGRDHAITTLPAVSSLIALRQLTPNREAASDGYAGYGDPILSGDPSSCRSAKPRLACKGIEVPVDQIAERATIRGRGGRRSGNASTDNVFAKGSTREAMMAQVRGLCPLPDTGYEIKCVAEGFAAKAPLIRLAGEATETHIKTLSDSGKLARYRVLHFATHGLLSGDVEVMAKRQGEPALVLTPPDKSTDDEDDGLLMASEVAALKLNADWVVLSACNTAAGDRIGAQALSGLARAFFYAGGRALLVSHWPVYSDAAVRLTTRAFAELERNPKAGRSEALQRAMADLMDDRSQVDNAHPAVWGPFVVVGDGRR